MSRARITLRWWVLLDTDSGSDVDDAFALALVLARWAGPSASATRPSHPRPGVEGAV